MKNVIQILSIVLIIVLLIILIVRKYESFTTNTFISEEINKMGDTLIQPYKCKFISDVVVPNKIIKNNIRRSNYNILTEMKALLSGKTSLNPIYKTI